MLTPTTAAMMLDTETGESPEAAPDAADALLALQRRTADALAGYVTMVDKAEPEFRPVAERYRAIHDRHGVEPDADGSFMGTVNKAVVSLRALFDDIDADVMDSIRNGENYVLEAFDDAIGAAGMPPADVTLLRDMRDELVVLLQDTRHLD